MSVDWFSCPSCEETYPDCSDRIFFCDCEISFCSADCGKRVIDEKTDKSTCKYCRNEETTDYQLLHFLLRKFSLTKEQAIELCLKENLSDSAGD